ncbi:FIG099352: hypothetical protein [hydrothermal vent metagenome]|uniref:Nickel insertion protein n=1 Tax=hydrothermal vent metagenome TaxID=652676 RepID=A0A3B1C4E2_9ZZZZ
MKTAYFDCFSGVSGDMILAVLIDAGLSPAKLKRELRKLKLDGYAISVSQVKKSGISATNVKVRVDKNKNRVHRTFSDIKKIIDKSTLEPDIKKRSLAVFKVIAEAEAIVHGTTPAKVHFHEVGAIDSIIDVVGAVIGFSILGIDVITASPINIGAGMVKTEHGIMPVPAPATAIILKDVPTYSDGPAKELTTPTGAAILKTFAKSFGPQPSMKYKNVGNGAGGYDFADWPNILRVFISEDCASLKTEKLALLSANIDDMTPEAVSVAQDALFMAGALDVTVTPALMKKGRPAVIVSALCHPGKVPAVEMAFFVNTSTLGVRHTTVNRASLPRKIKKVKTEFGVVDVKVAFLPDGTERDSPEFESVKKIALHKKVPFDVVYRSALEKRV